MKKILIIETSLFRGRGGGGSYLQAKYYEEVLRQKNYRVEFFIGEAKINQYLKRLKLIRKISKSDIVIGFGTPLLCSYLQWLCFVLRKKGIFCIDTYISSRDIIKDHLKRKMFPAKIIFYTIFSSLLNKVFMFFLPPKFNLVTLTSCRYIWDKLKHTRLKHNGNEFLYPRIALKKRIRAANRSKTVLYYGTLYRGRGVVDLLKASRLLWKKGLSFKLSIYGFPIDQYTRQTLSKEINKDESDRIIIKDKVDDIEVIVKKATVAVLPFRYPCSFQTPYTLLEPMAWGIPVVTTDVGSHREWIKDKETGLFCEKENIDDIADKIEIVFNDTALIEKITQN